MTGQGTIPTAVEAIKRGASDFIPKPFDKDVLLKKLEAIRTRAYLENRVTNLRELVSDKYGFENIISSSQAMMDVFEVASAAVSSDAPALIVGETGTGKELIAKAIHVKSKRGNEPFIGVNCEAIPKELLESELFGYKKGSFTGALKDHEGLFMAADKGTIFLDEIGAMPKEFQVRLLRALQERKVRPIGSATELPVDIRIISATNRTLDELKNTYLREDMFFRLAVILIDLPPLRKRREDIPLLVEHFIRAFNNAYSKNIMGITESGLITLYRYGFPGNIRELENLIERIIAVMPPNRTEITEKDIKSHLLLSVAKAQETSLSLVELERVAIEQAIRECKGNKSKAAKVLGISRDTFYKKIKLFEIEA